MSSELVDFALANLCANGCAMVPKTREPGHMSHVPFSLFPRKLSDKAFQQAKTLAVPFNELTDKVARDTKWLVTTLQP
jgi:hypothetical protein